MRLRAFDARMLMAQRQGKTSFYMQHLGEEAVSTAFRKALKAGDPGVSLRGVEFVEELPKTISGKIRRVELRTREAHLHPGGPEGGTTGEHTEFSDSDFPSLRGK